MAIKSIVFHSFDEKELTRQIRKNKAGIVDNVQCLALDTPKSIIRGIMAANGFKIDKIDDYNALIQDLGQANSQPWINFIFSLTASRLWNSFSIKNTTVSPFQYCSLMNRNRETKSLYDNVIRLVALSGGRKDRSDCMVVSTDPVFLTVCAELGFRIGMAYPRGMTLAMYFRGFVQGIVRRAVIVAILCYLKFSTRKMHNKVLTACEGREPLWIASTFLPGLVSTKSGHDDRYEPVATMIEKETGTRLVYAGWVSLKKDIAGLRAVLEKIHAKGTSSLFVTNFSGIRSLVRFLFPLEMIKIFFCFLRKRKELRLAFSGIPMEFFLECEFFNSYLCTGETNETFYYYRLVENSYGELFKQLKPKFVTTFLEGYNFGRAVIAACRRFDIPVLGWQESLLHSMRLYYRWGKNLCQDDIADRRVSESYLYPDYFCTWSDHAKELLVENGMDEKRIIVLGATRYRHFVSKVSERISSRECKINKAENILLVGTAALNESIAMVDFINEALHDRSDIAVRFRPHPQTTAYFNAKNGAWLGWVRISENSFDDDLNWSEIVVSSWSTMLCEAFLMGKRCISIFTAGWVSQPPLEEKYCKYFTDTSMFREYILNICNEEGISDLSETARLLLGDNAVNTGSVINEMVFSGSSAKFVGKIGRG